MQQDKFIRNEKNILKTVRWMKYFLYFKDTGNFVSGKMVKNSTGVKNWYQFTLINRNAKKAS